MLNHPLAVSFSILKNLKKKKKEIKYRYIWIKKNYFSTRD